MACHLFSTKPLSKPMLRYCQLDTKEISIKIQNFSDENPPENIVCEMAAILSRGRWGFLLGGWVGVGVGAGGRWVNEQWMDSLGASNKKKFSWLYMYYKVGQLQYQRVWLIIGEIYMCYLAVKHLRTFACNFFSGGGGVGMGSGHKVGSVLLPGFAIIW